MTGGNCSFNTSCAEMTTIILGAFGDTACEHALHFTCVLFPSSVSFQTLCCTVGAASTCWLYTGSCWLTRYWWTGRPCRMQVTHTAGASYPHWRYSWVSWLTVQIRCLHVPDLICSPILSTFPVLLDQPDLLDALRVSSKSFMVKLISGCILIMLFIIAVLYWVKKYCIQNHLLPTLLG